jgi:hypothetical protein
MTRETAVFEVNASRYTDYELLGRCSVGLLSLLGNKGACVVRACVRVLPVVNGCMRERRRERLRVCLRAVIG